MSSELVAPAGQAADPVLLQIAAHGLVLSLLPEDDQEQQ